MNRHAGWENARTGRRRRWGYGLAALAVLAAAVAGGAGQAAGESGGLPGPNGGGFDPAAGTEANSCVSPGGVDLNGLYGVSEQVVTFFCTQVDAGEHWTAPG